MYFNGGGWERTALNHFSERLKNQNLQMSPFLHIIGRNKILFPPPHLLEIKEVATNSSIEVNGPGFAPFLMYSLGVNRLLKKKSVARNRFSLMPNSHGNAVPFSGDLRGKRGRRNPAGACFFSRAQCTGRSVLGEVSDAAVQPPRVSTSTQPTLTIAFALIIP